MLLRKNIIQFFFFKLSIKIYHHFRSLTVTLCTRDKYIYCCVYFRRRHHRPLCWQSCIYLYVFVSPCDYANHIAVVRRRGAVFHHPMIHQHRPLLFWLICDAWMSWGVLGLLVRPKQIKMIKIGWYILMKIRKLYIIQYRRTLLIQTLRTDTLNKWEKRTKL